MPGTSLVTAGLRAGVKRGRPLGMAVRASAKGAAKGTRITVMDAGDRAATLALSESLAAPVRAPVEDDLVVAVLTPAADLGLIASRLSEHRRGGGDVLLAVAGSTAERRDQLTALRAEPDLGVAVAFPVEGLDGSDMEEFRDAVVRRLGTEVGGAARVSRLLRETATHGIVDRSAKRAALIAFLSGSRASSSVLTALQARMAADVGNLAGEQPQAVQAGQAVGAAVAAPIWRQVARGLSAALPGWKPLVRAGVAYAGTRLVGLVATRLRRPPTHSEASEEES